MNRNNILVVGDAMLDKHFLGEVKRISPEAPVPVVDTLEVKCTLGGAANVAAQISVAANRTILLYKATRGSTGSEDKEMRSLLDEFRVRANRLWMDSKHNCSTIPIKNRIWAGNQQVCRVDIENTKSPTKMEQEEWIQTILRIVKEEHIGKVVFSDYDKGTLTDEMLSRLADILADSDILTILDPKRPTFPTIKHLSIVKPNRKELSSTGFADIEAVSSRMEGTLVVETRSEDPTQIADDGVKFASVSAEIFIEAVDVCGAGDIHCAILALAFDGDNIVEAVGAANRAAGISVQHLGCYTLDEEEIQTCLKDLTS